MAQYKVAVGDNASLRTYQASANLSASAGLPVTDSSGKIAVNTSATTASIGILVEAAGTATDAACTVCIGGQVQAIADGTITEMADLKADTTGVADTTTKGNYWVGQALEDGVDADLVWINVNPGRVGTYA